MLYQNNICYFYYINIVMEFGKKTEKKLYKYLKNRRKIS